jgi:hypothetical protein
LFRLGGTWNLNKIFREIDNLLAFDLAERRNGWAGGMPGSLWMLRTMFNLAVTNGLLEASAASSPLAPLSARMLRLICIRQHK